MTKRIFEITTGLLTFSKATGGVFGRHSLERTLEAALDLVASRFDYEEKRLVHAYKDTLPTIWCDRDRLEQVFVNVCINALEAMSKGGTLTVSARSDRQDGTVTLDFADTGKGMTAKEASRAFDPFYTTKDTGSGLGLAICYSIVEEHKGGISLKSAPGKGTTVSVALPINKAK